MKSDENMIFIRFHQISSDFIRFHQISSELFFSNFHMPMNQNQIEIQTKQDMYTQNQTFHCSCFAFKLFLVQPFCFCSHGETNESYEKGDEINPCKGEANLWEEATNLCKGKANPCKGEANPCKGETFEKGCSPRNFEKKQLAKVGAVVSARQN